MISGLAIMHLKPSICVVVCEGMWCLLFLQQAVMKLNNSSDSNAVERT